MRRSTRLATARGAQTRAGRNTANETAKPGSNIESVKGVVPAPPRKRQKTKAGSVCSASSPDSVSLLHQLPLDMLFEILGYLDPISLLYLSLSSRDLRKTLMSRSLVWIWKTSYALTDHGLPPAPDDLNIPQFLSFMVDEICDTCNKQCQEDGFVRVWSARLRYCFECRENSPAIVAEKRMRRDIKIVRDIQRYFGQRDYPVHTLFPFFLDDYNDEERAYPRASIEELVRDFERDTKHKRIEVKKTWLSERAEKEGRIRTHAEICEKWQDEQFERRAEREEKIRDERRKEILERLKEVGWYDEAVNARHARRFKENDFVAKAQPLADKEWNQAKHTLFSFLRTLKEERLADEREKARMDRYLALRKTYLDYRALKMSDGQSVLPDVGDLVTFEEVLALVEGTPFDQEVPAQDMLALFDNLLQTRFPKWKASCDNALVDILNAADKKRKQPATSADLKLAVTVFRYTKWPRGGPLLYPNVLQGRHEGMGHSGLPVAQHPFSANDIGVKVTILRLAKKLVELAGLDPQTATSEDMDKRDAWYLRACDIAYREDGLSVHVMLWRAALENYEIIGERRWRSMFYSLTRTQHLPERRARTRDVVLAAHSSSRSQQS
ncbi:hypothetical protein K525DRAFT_253731, partial [Schizophyllum commune Loenen D]